MKTISPNNFGNNLSLEQCPRMSVDSLIREVKQELKESLLHSKLEAMGVKIELCSSNTRFKGKRIWFKCPVCKSRVGILFYHPISEYIGCRKCVGADYKDRRYKGMVEQTKTLTKVSYNKG